MRRMGKEITRMFIIYDDGSSIELYEGRTGRRDKTATDNYLNTKGWLK